MDGTERAKTSYKSSLKKTEKKPQQQQKKIKKLKIPSLTHAHSHIHKQIKLSVISTVRDNTLNTRLKALD